MRVAECADCQRVAYRLHGHDSQGGFLVEQQAYLEERDGLISWMRVLCSGFRPAPPNGTSLPARAPEGNEEAIAAWNGPLFERFVRFREVLTTGLGAHGEEALRRNPSHAGSRVLDIGCGFGDTTQQIAELVGPRGVAVGVDVAPRFVELARREAEAAGFANARFHIADVQAGLPEHRFNYAFSRFGTMFFANPVLALRNVRRALLPGRAR